MSGRQRGQRVGEEDGARAALPDPARRAEAASRRLQLFAERRVRHLVAQLDRVGQAEFRDHASDFQAIRARGDVVQGHLLHFSLLEGQRNIRLREGLSGA